MRPLLFEILDIIEDWQARTGFHLWPGDSPEKKRKFIRWSYESGYLTPLVDLNGRLAGFLFFYRGHDPAGINQSRPDNGGRYVVCDCLWVRPDLRGTGALKSLIRLALKENRDKVLGGERLLFQRYRAGEYRERRYNFPKFYRRFQGGEGRQFNNAGTDSSAINKCSGYDRRSGART